MALPVQPPRPDAPYHPILRGQSVLVTGGTSGIGRAVAVAMAKAGADVAVNGRSAGEEADAVVAEIEATGRRGLSVPADVSDEAAVDRMVETVCDAFGALDVLVANAGMQRDAPLQAMSLDVWRTVIDVNLTGQFLCARAAVRAFRRQGIVEARSCRAGKIICMSSVHDLIPWAGHANYAASKGGVAMLMKTMAQEFAPHRVRVNGIAPGAIRTPINRDARSDETSLGRLLDLIPAGRIGEPDDVAQAAVWLASDAADYVHGTMLYVDGGMALYPGFAEGG